MAHRLAAEIDEDPPTLCAHESFRRLLDREGLLQPRRSNVLAELRDLRLQRLVRAQVLFGEEREHLLADGGRVGSEQQVPPPRRRQEVVRVPAQQRQLDAQLAQ